MVDTLASIYTTVTFPFITTIANRPVKEDILFWTVSKVIMFVTGLFELFESLTITGIRLLLGPLLDHLGLQNVL